MKRPQFRLVTLVWLTLVAGLAAAWYLQFRTSRQHLARSLAQQAMLDNKQAHLEYQQELHRLQMEDVRAADALNHQTRTLTRIAAAFPETVRGVEFLPPHRVTLLPTVDRLRLASVWSKVKIYQFRSSDLSDAVFEELKRQKSVISLSFQGTQPTPALLSRLAELKRLQRLNLEACSIGDEHLAEVAKIDTLESLQISHNPLITDEGIASLIRLPRLVELEIHQTNLDDASIPHLLNLRLMRLRLDGTKFTHGGQNRLKQELKRGDGVVDWHVFAMRYPR